MIQDPKPLPAGAHRLELLCACGARIDPRDKIALHLDTRCRECGGRQRVWWRRRVTLRERLGAWLALRAWKRRRRCRV